MPTDAEIGHMGRREARRTRLLELAAEYIADDGNAEMLLYDAAYAVETGAPDVSDVLHILSLIMGNDPAEVELRKRFHVLAMSALRKSEALSRMRPFVAVTATDVGRRVVTIAREVIANDTAPVRDFVSRAVLSLLKACDKRLGLVPTEMPAALVRAIESFDGDEPEDLAVRLLRAAGLPAKKAHNVIKASENMQITRDKKRR